MLKIHLAALDMDGTLLSGAKEITPGTWDALGELKRRGIPAALCTGRGLSEVTLFPGLTETVPYGILTSGALVRRFDTGQILSAKRIGAQTALEALERVKNEDAVPHLLTDTGSVCREEDIALMETHHMGAYAPMFRAVCIKPGDMAAFVRDHPDELCKLNFYFRDKQARARGETLLAGLPLQLVHAEFSSLECTAPGVAKDWGLEVLCRHLGIGPENVLAVGDSENDIPMLKMAGCPVAMGNAPGSVRKWAAHRTGDNDSDGAAGAIRRFLPQMSPPGEKRPGTMGGKAPETT